MGAIYCSNKRLLVLVGGNQFFPPTNCHFNLANSKSAGEIEKKLLLTLNTKQCVFHDPHRCYKDELQVK